MNELTDGTVCAADAATGAEIGPYRKSWLELLREIFPPLLRLAILADLGNPSNVLDVAEAEAACRMLGLKVARSDVRRAEDIAPAFKALKGEAGALYVCLNPLFLNNRIRISTLALGARMPAIYASREHVEAGGLMSLWAELPGPVQARRRLC